jgi:hypothetical protein
MLAGVLTPSFSQHNFAKKKKLIRFSRRVFAQLAKKWYSATYRQRSQRTTTTPANDAQGDWGAAAR